MGTQQFSTVQTACSLRQTFDMSTMLMIQPVEGRLHFSRSVAHWGDAADGANERDARSASLTPT